MSCSLQQFPGNYRVLTSIPAGRAARSRCCCPQLTTGLLAGGYFCVVAWFEIFRDCVCLGALHVHLRTVSAKMHEGDTCICLRLCRWVSVCLWEIPNLKHMLVPAGQVSLTRASNVSPCSQLRANFDDLTWKVRPMSLMPVWALPRPPVTTASFKECVWALLKERLIGNERGLQMPPDSVQSFSYLTHTLTHVCARVHAHTHTQSQAGSHSHTHTHT